MKSENPAEKPPRAQEDQDLEAVLEAFMQADRQQSLLLLERESALLLSEQARLRVAEQIVEVSEIVETLKEKQRLLSAGTTAQSQRAREDQDLEAVLEAFMQADHEQSLLLLERESALLLSEQARIRVAEQIAELNEIVGTLKEKQGLLQESRSQHQRAFEAAQNQQPFRRPAFWPGQEEIASIMMDIPPGSLVRIVQQMMQPEQQDAFLQIIQQTFHPPAEQLQGIKTELERAAKQNIPHDLLAAVLESVSAQPLGEQKRFWMGEFTPEYVLSLLARKNIDIPALLRQAQLARPAEPDPALPAIHLPESQAGLQSDSSTSALLPTAGSDESMPPLDRTALVEHVIAAQQQIMRGGTKAALSLTPDQLALRADSTDPATAVITALYRMLYHLLGSENGRDRQEMGAALAAFDTLMSTGEVIKKIEPAQLRALNQIRSFFQFVLRGRGLDPDALAMNLGPLLDGAPGNEVAAQSVPILMRLLSQLGNVKGRQVADVQQFLRDVKDMSASGEGHQSDMLPSGMLPGYALLLRGHAYADMPLTQDEKSLEQALHAYEQALPFFTREARPNEWAELHLSRGQVYLRSATGDLAQKREQALEESLLALTVLTHTDRPLQWAAAHECCGEAYRLRFSRDRQSNLAQALWHYEEALRVFTPANAPKRWASTRIERVITQRLLQEESVDGGLREVRPTALLRDIFPGKNLLKWSALCRQLITDLDEVLALTRREEDGENWADAHYERGFLRAIMGQGERQTLLEQIFQDYQDALTVFTREDYPVRWADTHIKQVVVVQRYTYKGFEADAELALQWIAQALSVYTPERTPFEYYRAQELRALACQRLQRWTEAWQALGEARRVERSLLAQAHPGGKLYDLLAEFTHAEICLRSAQVALKLDPPDLRSALLALEEGRARHIALEEAAQKQIGTLPPPPQLADLRACVPDQSSALVYLAAGANKSASVEVDRHLSLGVDEGMAMILTLDTGGQPQIHALTLPNLTNMALTMLLEIATFEQPIGLPAEPEGSGQQRSSRPEKKFAMPIKLNDAVRTLGERGINDVARFLRAHQITHVTFIAYSILGLVPLNAVQVNLADNALHYLGDVFDVSFAPGARIAGMALQRARAVQGVRTVLSAGKPEPQASAFSHLPYAALEAQLLRKLAAAYGYRTTYLSPTEVTRTHLLEKLQGPAEESLYVDLALHAVYEARDPRQSYLVLAGSDETAQDERSIVLAELLDGSVKLNGVRILVLAACQSSVIDIRQIPNEVLGLAPAFLQAGCAGVIASLWKVDDRATYLLLTRFAQLYLEAHGALSPARALADAQRWLREEATYQVIVAYNPLQTFRAESQASDWNIDGFEEKARKTPHALPFAEPEYWAGFTLSGY